MEVEDRLAEHLELWRFLTGLFSWSRESCRPRAPDRCESRRGWRAYMPFGCSNGGKQNFPNFPIRGAWPRGHRTYRRTGHWRPAWRSASVSELDFSEVKTRTGEACRRGENRITAKMCNYDRPHNTVDTRGNDDCGGPRACFIPDELNQKLRPRWVCAGITTFNARTPIQPRVTATRVPPGRWGRVATWGAVCAERVCVPLRFGEDRQRASGRRNSERQLYIDCQAQDAALHCKSLEVRRHPCDRASGAAKRVACFPSLKTRGKLAVLLSE